MISAINFERSTAIREDPLAQKERYETKVSETIMVLKSRYEENTWQSRDNIGKTTVMGEEPHAPQNTPIAPRVNGTKVTDSTKPLFLAKKKVWDSVGSIKKDQWAWRRTIMHLRTDFFYFVLIDLRTDLKVILLQRQ